MSKSKPPALAPRVFRLGRRDVLRGALLLAAPAMGFSLGGCSSDDEGSNNTPSLDAKTVFVHGVASGDPLPDAVILWTRVTITDASSADVAWEVAEDVAMTKRIANGTFKTDAQRDWTVKVDARGLSAGKTYYYRFEVRGAKSPIGRTRTAPSGANDRLRFAVTSCASMAHGYFHTYRALAARADLDAVIHLGDYIYEYADGQYGDVRKYEPAHEIVNLADYRTRHSHYKRDADLQAVHRQHPFICIWDDHEVANDAYVDGAENHDSATEGSWADRKAAAQRAYFEWMPVREQAGNKIYRKLAYGDLADIVLLDTRHQARTKPDEGLLGPAPASDPSRTLLGTEQEAWMQDTLKGSKAQWKLLAQQVMVGNLQLDGGQIANLDQWHGYPDARNRLLTFFRDSGVKNIVVLTGDIHSSWANDLIFDPLDKAAYDPATGRGSVAVELVTPAVSSPGVPANFTPYLTSARPLNPHIQWFDPQLRGFILLDVTRERVQSAWFLFEDITKPEGGPANFTKAYAVKTGETHLVEEPAAAPDREGAPALAPAPSA